MARPTKPEHEQRRRRVRFLLSAGELSKVKAKAGRGGMTSIHLFARALAVGGRLDVRQRQGLPFMAVYQANRLGVVLQQVEAHAEQYGYAVPSFDTLQAAIAEVFNYDYENTVLARALEDDPRPHNVEFLLTDDEHRRVKQRAERLNLSVNDYARLCTIGARFYVLVGDPFPDEAIETVRRQGRAIWDALGESRATKQPLPPLAEPVRILEEVFNAHYLPRLRVDGCDQAA